MKKTFVEVLLELPVDAALRDFLTAAGLDMPSDFAWDDTPETSRALVDAIRHWPDLVARDALIAKLVASVGLCDHAGKQAMFQIAAGHGPALMGLVACQSDLHRSFWLSVNHPDLFDRAGDVDYFERHGSQAQQNDLGVHRHPNGSDTALAGLRHAISGFYQRELQCGDGCVAYLVQRNPGVYLLTVHVKDLAMLRLEFEGANLTRRVGNPNIHMVLEYAVATGVTRTLAKGGEKYHQMLADAFAEHLLGVKVDPQRIMPPTLDLSSLRLGFDVPQAMADGFSAVQVKMLSLMSPDATLKLDCTAMAPSNQRCVTELLHEQLPTPLIENWLVMAAHINLYYPPEPGRTRAKVVTVEVTRKGRLNLHKFDAPLQAQLESYLVALGILQPGQTLRAQEIAPEADGSNEQALAEDR